MTFRELCVTAGPPSGGPAVTVFRDRYTTGAAVLVPRHGGGLHGYSRVLVRPVLRTGDPHPVWLAKQRERERLDRIPLADRMPDAGGFRALCMTGQTLPLVQALATTWPTDAHAATCWIAGCPAAPRLLKEALASAAGAEVITDCWFCDVDYPPGFAWPADRNTAARELAGWLARLGEPLARAGFYLTRGGFRLVRPIDPPWRLSASSAGELEARLRRLLLACAATGLGPVMRGRRPDGPAIDASAAEWTRLVRLPFVVRDGVPQRLPIDLSRMQPVDLRAFDPVWPAPGPATSRQVPVDLPALPDLATAGTAWASGWLAGCPPAIEGQGGDTLTFRLARALLDAGATELEAFEALRGWNRRCRPPWTDTGLWQKVCNARRYGSGSPPGRLF